MAPLAPPGWSSLTPGAKLTIVKQAPDGHEVARYPGVVIANSDNDHWLEARAVWTYREVEVDGLWFRPGDTLHEYFSPTEWFNAFLVLAPEGESRGWYTNVTYPTELAVDAGEALLTWRDLYIDVVMRPDGTVAVQDEDELTNSGLAKREPALHRKILATRDLILRKIAARSIPFDQRGSG
jgi:hypothetical protein